ncbi:malonyl-CoA decarboxylase [Rhodovulum imhoffii]|uniref:Malonyl-CoA decarboxylase n=1 Tax=Rhodovulum imhoffii TaxID=365340 RepID=A0A2T5BNX7_9RHOB|nr:malonyl-CoA decarboxylase family protein [Rhodovulum imhoffii]MBK5932548.1 decarboxylase [Rhodovulum imhoffii]PTN00689.1 malonyl-CoA decarboxylase [Rhodovulum imhoffii]
MTLFGNLMSTIFERRYIGAGRRDLDGLDMADLAQRLLTTRAESTALALAGQILERYATLDDAEKMTFFRMTVEQFNITPTRVREALEAYEAAPGKDTYRTYMEAAEPPRQELIRRLNQVPGATGRLVGMRADLRRLAAQSPEIGALDLDFRHLFNSWFNRGFLVLLPVNWETPANILEKIIAYEAVHALDDWEDLRRRLEPEDRRCFAFFHPAMPDEPLIFVQVALLKGVPDSIQTLLAEDRAPLKAEQADTAVFYSISNCQIGLAGISFGNSLIKQVVRDLSATLPNLKTFVTLSPIPGLMDWLHRHDRARAARTDPEVLRRLAALYLLEAKGAGGVPQDPVARFHLANGALVHAIHAGADTSQRGMARSGGAMVNYLYDLSRISRNAETYADTQDVAASSAVRALAKAALKSETQGA